MNSNEKMSDDEEKSPKLQMYEIFNKIQSVTDTKNNLKKLITLYENENINEFISNLEKIFAIIFYNYDKNTVPLKNIREFLKTFLDKITKNQKNKKKNEEFINYFCELFIHNSKKIKYKTLNIYFLNIFLYPYVNGGILLYKSDTLENIKIYVLNLLKSKTPSILNNVLHLLDKVSDLQKDNEIWGMLENLMNGDNKNIKKEIIKIFENNNENITKYLIDMIDDESSEMRLFAFEKLTKIQNFDVLDSKIKIKIFFIGLSDNNPKIKQAAQKILKNYLDLLGILKQKNFNIENKMDLDEESNNLNKNNDSIMKFEESNNKKENNIISSAKDKIEKATTPLKFKTKKLNDSPSRIFDELDITTYYNHPKFSYVFNLIVENMFEIIEKEDLIKYCKEIIDNLKNIILDKKRPSINSQYSTNSINKEKEKYDKYALFNDIFFLQNVITVLNQNKQNDSFKNDIIDLLPDGNTYSKILTHFYITSQNIYILHQLLLLAQYMSFQDEVGNREISNFLKAFISDYTLINKKCKDFVFRKLNFENFNNNNNIYEDNFDEMFDYSKNMTEEKYNELKVNNYLLPFNRKIIVSMDDLIDDALKIAKMMYLGKDNQLFVYIMEVVSELKENVESENQNSIKNKEKDLLEKVKEKVAIIDNLEEKLKKNTNNRIEIQLKLKEENELLNKYDNELVEITNQEGDILYRINKLCKFIIINCHLPQSNFDHMVKDIVVPSLKKNSFPAVVLIGLEITGLLAINHFDSPYKNFLKIFFDNLSKDEPHEFNSNNLTTLSIILDSMLQNNLLLLPPEILNGTIDEKVQILIDKYLYCENYEARFIVFTGLCKLLISNKLSRHEFILSRLFVCLYKSYKIIDKKSMEYNIKIQEMMNNFMYFYSLSGKDHINNIIKAICIILTSQFYFTNDINFDRNVLCDYNNTKFEFLNQFLFIVFENAKDKVKDNNYLSLIFKIFKYLFHLYNLVKVFENDKKKTEFEEEIFNKIDFTLSKIKCTKTQIYKFFDKTDYDRGLFDYFREKDNFGKFFAYLDKLGKNNSLLDFSGTLNDEYENIVEKNYKVEINGTIIDYNSKEKQNEINLYLEKQEKKYYNLISEYYDFCMQLKSSKLTNLFRQNNDIIEENEEDEESENEGVKNNVKKNSKLKPKKEITSAKKKKKTKSKKK